MFEIRTRDLVTYLRPLILACISTLILLKLIDSYYQTNSQLFYLQYSINDPTISSLALFCLSILLYTIAIIQPLRAHYAIQNMAVVRSKKTESKRVLIDCSNLWLVIMITTSIWDALCYGHIFWQEIVIFLVGYLLSWLLVIKIKLSNLLVVLLVLVQILVRLVLRL